jgi:hypothetical protein
MKILDSPSIPAMIVDLDGTLCNDGHRKIHLLNKDWESYHGALHLDKPYADVVALIDKLIDRWDVVALTGRPEAHRLQTEKWLVDNDIAVDLVLMRPDGNYESDAIIKPKVLELAFGSMEKAKERVAFILEDRDIMVAAWRQLGFNCWQVREGTH